MCLYRSISKLQRTAVQYGMSAVISPARKSGTTTYRHRMWHPRQQEVHQCFGGGDGARQEMRARNNTGIARILH